MPLHRPAVAGRVAVLLYGTLLLHPALLAQHTGTQIMFLFSSSSFFLLFCIYAALDPKLGSHRLFPLLPHHLDGTEVSFIVTTIGKLSDEEGMSILLFFRMLIDLIITRVPQRNTSCVILFILLYYYVRLNFPFQTYLYRNCAWFVRC